MHQIQLFLPLYNKEVNAFPHSYYEKVKEYLNNKFGGITLYTRTPVIGLWKDSPDSTMKDELIIYEILSENLDDSFWKHYKLELQSLFQQEEIMIKSSEIRML